MREAMIFRRTVIYVWISFFALSNAHLFSFDGIRYYAKYLDWETFGVNSSGNELWTGIVKDCSRKMSFSCIQKNAYTYLDNTFVERDNFTVFEGFVLKRNNLDYDTMTKKHKDKYNVHENLVEASSEQENNSAETKDDQPEARIEEEEEEETNTKHHEEYKTPLEEITSALHEKTVKFLATRDYELQLPEFFFEGSTVKISPREIDEKGALIRVDFGQRGLETEGRLFKKLSKKIRKFIQNKLLMSFLALILIIKLIKVKFMFVIPFLFGIGTAKKLFLKLLLFLVPAFAHVFKLCSSYYTSNANKFHHHHHQIAHHHHHVPVPVPVPTYFAPHGHHGHRHEEEYEGYDYAHPHIQLRKDMDELREWGIEPLEDAFDGPIPDHAPLSPVYPGNSFPIPQHAPPSRPPPGLPFPAKYPGPLGGHAQNLAYNAYVEEQNKFHRRISPAVAPAISPVPQVQQIQQVHQAQQVPQVAATSMNIQLPASNPGASAKTSPKTTYNVYPQQNSINIPQQVNVQQVASRPIQQAVPQRVAQPQQQQQQSQLPTKPIVSVASSAVQSNNRVVHEDAFYGPILERLEDVFAQLRFVEESCRERLICSMYKNPPLYSPHSNIVSNELSRDPQELKRGGSGSNASHRFYRYLNAARVGQDGGDCLRTYPCQINTE